MGIVDTIARKFLNEAQIISKKEIADNAFHLTIAGKALINLPYIPGQNVRIFIGMNKDLGFREKVRTYSIWNYDSVVGIMELAICAHSDGPGSAWIKSVQIGEAIFLTAPQGKFILDSSASTYVFIGDATALAHLYEIRRKLPEGKTMYSIMYAEKKTQLFADLNGLYPFDFYELPENPLEEIKKIIENKSGINDFDTIVYIGGDGRMCVGMNTYFRKEKGLKTKHIKTKPFWISGKQGLE